VNKKSRRADRGEKTEGHLIVLEISSTEELMLSFLKIDIPINYKHINSVSLLLSPS
jgi:hypothetical protein